MSALTSLLARDQAVPVRKIEEALQRLVVVGGDMGTSLLECDALPENVLAAYQAALHSLLPATRDEVMRVSRETVRLIPREVAEKHRIAPLAIDGRALLVAVAEPLPKDVESQLGFLLGYELVLRVVCDVRISAALLHHYGVEAPVKHRRLIDTLRHRDAGPVPYVAPPDAAILEERAQKSVARKSLASAWLDELDEPDTGPEPEPVRASIAPPPSEGRTTDPLGIHSSKITELLGDLVLKPETIPSPPPAGAAELEFDGSDTMPYALPTASSAVMSIEDAQRAASIAPPPASIAPPPSSIAPPPSSIAPPPSSIAPPSSSIAPTPRTSVFPSSAGQELAVNPTLGVGVRRSQPPPPMERPRVAPIVEIAEAEPSEGVRERARASSKVRGPLTAAQGVKLLADATTRDDIVGVFFGFSRQFFDYSALFSVASDRADGLDAFGDGASLATVRGHSFSLEETSRPSRLVLAKSTLQAQLGRAVTDEDHAFLRVLERPLNTFTVVQPVVLRGRAVLLFVGDRGGDAFTLSDVPEFVGFVPRVVDAIEKLILRKKREGAASKEAPAPAPAPAPSEPPPRKVDRWAPSSVASLDEGVSTERRRSPSLLDAIAATGIADLRPELDAIAARGFQEAPGEIRPLATLPPEDELFAESEPTDAPRSLLESSAPFASILPASPDGDLGEELEPEHATIPMPGRIRSEPAEASIEALRRLPRRSPTMREVLGIPRAAPPPPTTHGNLFETTSELTVDGESALPPSVEADASVEGTLAYEGPSKTIPAPPPPSDDDDDEPELVFGTDEEEDEEDGDEDEEDENPIRSAPTEPGKRIDGSPPIRSARAVSDRLPRRDPRREDDGPVQHDVVLTRSLRPTDSHNVPSVIVDGLLYERPTHDREVPSVIVDMGDNVRALVDDLAHASPDGETPSIDLLLRLGEAALPVLAQAFPGPLWFDRRGPHRKLPRGRDISGIARGIVAFRDRAAPYVRALLGATVADRRFYALLVASEIPSGVLVEAIAHLAFDADLGIRSLAVEILPKFASFPEFEAQLVSIRRTARIRGKDPERRLQAIALLAALRDGDAVQTLTDLLEDDDVAVRRACHGALVAITCEDLGDSSRRWAAWVERHQKEHRVEWLIEALTGSDDHLRARAGEELKSLTQQYFGYHSGASRREREVVQSKYRSWWEAQGRPLFTK